MRITTTYQPTVAEITRGLRFARRRARTWLWGIAIACVVLGPVSLALGSYTTGGACTVLGILYLYVLVWGQKRVISKQADRLCRPTQLTITEESYSIETDLVKGEVKWPAFVRIEDSPEFVLLYQTKRAISVLPKRALDKDQVAELSAFIADYNGRRI